MTKQTLNLLCVTGYTDGEGCFHLNIHKNKNVKSGYSIKLVYQITPHHTEL